MSDNNSFNSILNKYRKYSFSERDKGDKFERLMQGYLLTDPKYAYQLKKVWLWNEFPSKADLGGGDTGIDLVALTNDGDYWAYIGQMVKKKESFIFLFSISLAYQVKMPIPPP